MNISYNWLKDLIDIRLSPEETAKKLTSVGLAVEGIHAKADDFVFDIDLTSNRSDCLSHLGVAREIGAITNQNLRITNHESQKPDAENQNLVTIEDADLCHRFTARIIRRVKIGESPEWLKQRLEAVGERSINNVADITNYVMHELGQPMHSFDFNKLAGNRIVVRRARNGETIKTLDEVERKPDETMLAICDAEKPVAVAGVMGGFDSGISGETTDVLLEVAYFKRDNIRQTSRKLKLSTEASHHFERGVDIENLIRASNRATELICELAGGTAGEFVDVYPTKFPLNEIESKDIQYAVKRLTGLDVEKAEILRILNALGITQKDSELRTQNSELFTSPSWRHDIAIEEDLVEEVARLVGYDKIGEELPPAFGAGDYQPSERQKKSLRRTLTGAGFNESISYSFINTAQDEEFEFVPDLIDKTAAEKFITLQDSIIEGAARMRSTLLFGLLEAARHNFNFGSKDLKLFEIGKVFAAANSGELPTEKEIFALLITGNELNAGKALPLREYDFYNAKGALETAISAMNLPNAEFKAAKIKHLRAGQSAEVLFNGEKIGSIGRLNDKIVQNYKFKQPVFVAEIDLQKILSAPKATIVYHPLSKFPAVARDVSLLIKRDVSFEDLRRAVIEQNVSICRNVEFVDVYEGQGIADDERSVTIRLEYRDDEKTLRDEEVDGVHSEILRKLEAELNARQRF